MNKVTSIISIGIVVLASIAVVNYSSVDVEKINDDISTVPPSAGGLKTKDATSTSISTDTSGLGGTTSGSSSGLKTTKIYKVTSADGVTSFSDVPRGVAKKSSTTTSTVASVTTTETTTTSTPTTTTTSTPTTTTTSTPTTTTTSTPTTTTSTSTTEAVVAEVIEVATTAPESTVSSPSISTSQTVKHSKWESQFAMLPQDENGWSIITPASDSRFIYVSSSSGNDSIGKVYASSEIGNPKNPSINVAAFKTIEKALSLQRAGYSDWVLLKRGEQWELNHEISLPSGRSANSPAVLTSYGISSKRPLIKMGDSHAIRLIGSRKFISVIGLEFYANKRDPDSIDFAGWGNFNAGAGFVSYADTFEAESLHLEDNVFKYFVNSVVLNGKVRHKNISVRRNQFLYAYTEGGHSQGMYTKITSMLLEGNLFDHNGWYQQNYAKLNSGEQGQATIFNHNAYLVNMKDTVITGNIFANASSMGLKLTANPDKLSGQNTVSAKNILIDNNLFLEGEIGISAGGNTNFQNGYRWSNISITNNVMMHIGNSQPTRRTLGWHIEIDDWDGGLVRGNYLLCNINPEVTNVYGIRINGYSRNITATENVLHGIKAYEGKAVYTASDENKEGILIEANNVASLDASCDSMVYSKQRVIDEFIDNAKKQSSMNWNKTYTANSFNRSVKSSLE